VLQNIGKADRTQDADFEEVKADFIQQQKHGYQLRKDLRTYLYSMRVANQALRNLHDTFYLYYEPTHLSRDRLKFLTQEHESAWDAYLNHTDKTFSEVVQYCSPFPQVRERIAKRNRKLIDYDGARHAYDSIINSSRRSDESDKKALDQLNYAKNTYDSFNIDLLNELPPLSDARMPLHVSVCRQFFDAAEKFHCQGAKVAKSIADLVHDDEFKLKRMPKRQHSFYIVSPQKPSEYRDRYGGSPDRNCVAYGDDIKNHENSQDLPDLSLDRKSVVGRDKGYFSASNLRPDRPGLVESAVISSTDKIHRQHYDSTGSEKLTLRRKVIHRYVPSEGGELALEKDQVLEILPCSGHLVNKKHKFKHFRMSISKKNFGATHRKGGDNGTGLCDNKCSSRGRSFLQESNRVITSFTLDSFSNFPMHSTSSLAWVVITIAKVRVPQRLDHGIIGLRPYLQKMKIYLELHSQYFQKTNILIL
uniref:BAR domain-containing protein n=1 Tax=Romanomermis culicivorax TaxID=13658 RepID=A0A915HR52_ROMCU